MKQLYLIRRQDFFEAIALKQLNPDNLHSAGNIWCEVSLTDDEKNNYKFPIALAY